MFSIYDILQEADGDENQTNDAPAAANDNAGNDQQGGNDNNQQGNDNPAGGNNDDDFNMDMSLEDDNAEGGGDDAGTDDTGDIDTGGGDTASPEGEPVEANTDMFGSLSAEEQTMKIVELKNQYTQLYNACDDLIEKISNIENTEETVAPVSKLVNTLTDLKKYITDYFYTQFDVMSYYENDVKLNYLLSIFVSVKEVLEGIYKINSQTDKNIE